ncbi:MAG TPA: hypothetical protein VF221_10245, partial [Chloroflexota bacterium]
ARSHHIDKSTMDFTSILKLIENDFHLPSLTSFDRKARSLNSSLSFTQKPLSSLVLSKRSCPASDININITVDGTYLRLIRHSYGDELEVRLKDGNISTLLITGTTAIRTRTNSPARLSDFRQGDRILADAIPDQARALLYGAGIVHDLDLVRFGPRTGQVVAAGQQANDIEVRFGKRTMLVDLVGSTHITRRNGRKGSVADVAPGVGVTVSGLLNTRLDEIVRVSSIKVAALPHGRGKPRP